MLGKLWNLKPHYLETSEKRERYVGPFDLEGHFGRDFRFYLCDTARFLPPEQIDTKYVFLKKKLNFIADIYIVL